MDVSLWFAFAAGVLSFFSPCVFPLLPAYVSHLTGGSGLRDNKAAAGRGILLSRSAGFIIGFSAIFIIMGASASVVGQFFSDYRKLIEQLAGILIVVFGLQMAGLLKIRLLMTEKRVMTDKPSMNLTGSIFLGMAFASGWSPCVGLALSSILLLASSTDTLNHGILLLSVYSLGLAIPFVIISFVLSHSLAIMKKINRQLNKLAYINGGIMILLGILVFSGQMQVISAWLSSYSLFSL
ncbi:cytochrome c biogenesis CcdA family protein [Metabacillus sp. 113a]|uniref:cytochrome c biogenesis CcdA family protein n=1 Tax=Metabacillus sp. 113a TaxID=3404706 RepID=UPI003CED3112